MNELTIKLTLQDADIIMKALIKLPYEQVVSIIQNFDKQVRDQIEAKK